VTLSTALSRSTSAFIDTIRPSPVSGFIFSGLKPSALGAKLRPPIADCAISTAASSGRPSPGPAASIQSIMSRVCAIIIASSDCAPSMTSPLAQSPASPGKAHCPALRMSAPMPSVTSTKTSVEVVIRPSSRASWRRFWVGSSVFSCPSSASAIG